MGAVASAVVEFHCACGQGFKARADQTVRLYFCPICGKQVEVPSLANGTQPSARPSNPTPRPTITVPQPDEPPAQARVLGVNLAIPTTVHGFLGYLLACWAVALLIGLVLPLFSLWLAPVSVALVAVASWAVVQQGWRLVRARARVLTEKDVPLLWGLVRLIAWDPTEGVLILRDKNVRFADDDLYDGRGGVRFLLPVLGEELALRVPLEVQSLHFADADVMTSEYLNLSVRGTMKWRIVDVRKFYLLVSRELRYTSDRHDGGGGGGNGPQAPAPAKPAVVATGVSTVDQLKDAAIEWLRWMAEHQTRAVISRVSSGLLVAEQVAAEVPGLGGGGPRSALAAAGGVGTQAPPEFGSATGGLAAAIHETIAERVGEYGILICEVSLQEIRLPAEIHRQCVEAARAAYLPLLAQREHAGKRAALQAEVELLGRDAVAAERVAGRAPAFGLSDFFSQFLLQRLTAIRDGTSAGTPLDAAVAAHVARNPPGSPAAAAKSDAKPS